MPVDTHEDIMPAAGIEGPNVVETHDDIQPAMGMEAAADKEDASDQEFNSAKTSRNQVPALFNHPALKSKRGSRNIDIGGGRFDKGTQHLADVHGIDSKVFDPFNRSKEHNKSVHQEFMQSPADTATIANVLNVIKEPEHRRQVIGNAHKYLKDDGEAYFSVYEGDGSGSGRATRDGWQENRKLASYLPEVRSLFPDAKVVGGAIVARKSIAKAYGGAIAGPKLTEENAKDFARRLILWSYAAAPFVNRSIHRATGGEVDPSVDQALDAARGASQADPAASAMETARSLTPMGFYSAAAEAASKIPQRAPIDQILNKVKGAPGVKAEELDWSGVKDAFAGQRSVDPQEVARHFQANLPALQETVYKEDDPEAAVNQFSHEELKDRGGRNYREVLLHLPYVAAEESNKVADFARSMREKYGDRWIGKLSQEEDNLYDSLLSLHEKAEGSGTTYNSSHYQSVPNIVAHLRMSDRGTYGFGDPEALHLEEVQSDWGQDMRDGREVPEGPHIGSSEGWTDLALKRALREAANGKYKKLTWSTGDDQINRYNLTKHVKHIMWSPDNQILSALTHGGGEAIGKKVNREDLPKYIGKEAAQKLLDQEPEIDGNMATHHLRGQDLAVGGEGMKSFYDRFLPGRLQKLVSKFDPEAKVQLRGHKMFVPDEEEGDSDEGEYKSVHSLEITPKLRAAILKGLPAYAGGGSVDDENSDDSWEDAFHATHANVQNFNLSKAGSGTTVGGLNAERAIFLTNDPQNAHTYLGGTFVKRANAPYTEEISPGVGRHYTEGANIMPLKVNTKDFDEWDYGGGLYNANHMKQIIKEARQNKVPGIKIENIKDQGYMGLGSGKKTTTYVVLDPSRIRSRFAAFDPKKSNKKDLMASSGGSIVNKALEVISGLRR